MRVGEGGRRGPGAVPSTGTSATRALPPAQDPAAVTPRSTQPTAAQDPGAVSGSPHSRSTPRHPCPCHTAPSGAGSPAGRWCASRSESAPWSAAPCRSEVLGREAGRWMPGPEPWAGAAGVGVGQGEAGTPAGGGEACSLGQGRSPQASQLRWPSPVHLGCPPPRAALISEPHPLPCGLFYFQGKRLGKSWPVLLKAADRCPGCPLSYGIASWRRNRHSLWVHMTAVGLGVARSGPGLAGVLGCGWGGGFRAFANL